MPVGATARTRAVQTLVPAAIKVSAAGGPWVTTRSGSRSGIRSSVYCQSPAQSGPVCTVAVAHPGRTSARRSTEITALPSGWPWQATAVCSLNAGDMGGGIAIGGWVTTGVVGTGAVDDGGAGVWLASGSSSPGGTPQLASGLVSKRAEATSAMPRATCRQVRGAGPAVTV